MLAFAFSGPAVCLWGQVSLDREGSNGGQKYSIVIHGGAGSSAANASPLQVKRRKASLAKALDRGVAILSSGG